ncbi:MAG: hypothetical protein ACT4PL_04725 [Phycisphaerales bacterium]
MPTLPPPPSRRSAPPAPPARRPAARQSAQTGHMAVAGENVAASALPYNDARWVMAVRTAQMAEGGRAAIIPPRSRRALLRQAKSIGIRAFDAHLIIAIVQDAIRSGRGALSRESQASLAMVAPAGPVTEPAFPWPLVVASLFMGFIIFSTVAEWITGTFR